jgi:hypothetical protein
MREIVITVVEVLPQPPENPENPENRMNRVVSDPRRHGIPGVGRASAATGAVDLSIIREPIHWMRWRRDVHQHGAYAPEYDGRSVQVQAFVLCLLLAGLAFMAAMLIVVLDHASLT